MALRARRNYYVVSKDAENNIMYVGGGEQDERRYKKELVVSEIHWIFEEGPKFPLECEARIRYRQPLQKCVIKKLLATRYSLLAVFDESQRAITPGQSIVFYDGDAVLGGGVIQ